MFLMDLNSKYFIARKSKPELQIFFCFPPLATEEAIGNENNNKKKNNTFIATETKFYIMQHSSTLFYLLLYLPRVSCAVFCRLVLEI